MRLRNPGPFLVLSSLLATATGGCNPLPPRAPDVLDRICPYWDAEEAPNRPEGVTPQVTTLCQVVHESCSKGRQVTLYAGNHMQLVRSSPPAPATSDEPAPTLVYVFEPSGIMVDRYQSLTGSEPMGPPLGMEHSSCAVCGIKPQPIVGEGQSPAQCAAGQASFYPISPDGRRQHRNDASRALHDGQKKPGRATK